MKPLLTFSVIALGSLSVAQGVLPAKYNSAPPKPGDVVAKVNGQPILASDVESLLWEWRGSDTTEDLISYMMVEQDAGRKGVVVADTEVEAEIDKELKALAQSRPDAPDWLKNQGFTRSRLFIRLKAKLLMEKILEKDFKPTNYVKVSSILVKPTSADAASVGEAIKKAQAGYDRLAKGESWDAVLAATTTEAQSVGVKGLLGWRELAAFPESVQAEMKGLALGAVTKPAQTQVGIQIFRIETRGADVKGDELAALKRLYFDVARQAYVQQLKASAKIERLRK